MAKIGIGNHDVLVVVDIQVVPVINRLAEHCPHVVLTQDWHTSDHLSFASSQPGKKPYDTITVDYGQQILWPAPRWEAPQNR
jgi:nicotinamidase/pyrazinamidase